MKSARTYRQSARAATTAENTTRVRDAALALFVERPFDQVTLHAVAERAGVGLQSVIRRVGTKEGLVEMVSQWVGPQVAAALGEPGAAAGRPDEVADAFARHYERWSGVVERTLHQADASPALADHAERGKVAHRAWVAAAFTDALAALDPVARRRVHAQLVAVTGVEVWLLLRRDAGLSFAEARTAMAGLVTGCLAPLPSLVPSPSPSPSPSPEES